MKARRWMGVLAGALVWAAPVLGQDDRTKTQAQDTEKSASTPPSTLEERVKALEELQQKQKSESEAPGRLKAYWKEGFFLESADKAFKVQVGGRILADAGWITADEDVEGVAGIGSQQDYFDFRSARLFVGGTMYERVEFMAQYDFAEGPGSSSQFKDVYLGLKKLPGIGNFRVGQFKEPFSIEQLTSNRHITFMERSVVDVFAPARKTGAMIFDAPREERMTWAVGVFRNTDDHGRDVGDGEYAVTGRLTGLPWYEEGGRRLWHLGAAASHRSPESDAVRVRQRPEVHDASRFVDTGILTNATGDDRLGLETALVVGPWSLQGEYVSNRVERRAAVNDELQFHGFYVFGSFLVTGENRSYSKAKSNFERVRPKANFLDGKGGLGAWEIAARYSNLDLIDDGIDGRELNTFTVGVNWYLNPMTRIMLNYMHGDLDRRGDDIGEVNAITMRFQVEF